MRFFFFEMYSSYHGKTTLGILILYDIYIYIYDDDDCIYI